MTNHNTVDQTLDEREATYGRVEFHATLAQALKAEMWCTGAWEDQDPDMKEALEMIQHKIARILNGDPCKADSWHDIAGYARLVERRLLYDQHDSPVPSGEDLVNAKPSQGIRTPEEWGIPDAEYQEVLKQQRALDDELRRVLTPCDREQTKAEVELDIRKLRAAEEDAIREGRRAAERKFRWESAESARHAQELQALNSREPTPAEVASIRRALAPYEGPATEGPGPRLGSSASVGPSQARMDRERPPMPYKTKDDEPPDGPLSWVSHR